MKCQTEVIKELKPRFRRMLKEEFVSACCGRESPFRSFEIGVKPPTEDYAWKNLDAVSQWNSSWTHDATFDGLLVTRTVRWREMGEQVCPYKVVFANLDDAARVLGSLRDLNHARRRGSAINSWLAKIAERTGSTIDLNRAAEVTARFSTKLQDFDDSEIDMVFLTVEWLANNDSSGLYVRELPIRGIDTKWYEGHKGCIDSFVSLYLPDWNSKIILKPPTQVRVRFLDESMFVAGLSDLSVVPSEFSLLDVPVRAVVIVENLTTLMTLPNMKNVIGVFGRGHAVTEISHIDGIDSVPCLYWGDIDVEGFRILSQWRQFHPTTESVIMDRGTLDEYSDLVVGDTAMSASKWERMGLVDNLNDDELEVYRSLRRDENDYARLEQERIPPQYTNPIIAKAIGRYALD